MSAKTKSFPVQGGHTAGIFADMSVDGPDIGTLVAIVDRAKNLPNRKTIGKQDPYCAARLGKEARKTATDVRGGQTPKWDQELRFPVHDSPDYYQLKISVFTDDKRTDLIGEAWVDLKSIVVPGGGQSDVWQTLSCRGKYAGEIRMEITFYDTRPKPEKPAVVRPKQPAPTEQEAGSLRQRSPAKRRPLPSDPVTGEAAPIPVATSTPPALEQPQQTPPRSHMKSTSHSGFIPSQSPLQSVEYNTPPPATRQIYPDHYSPSPHSQGYSTPSRVEGPRQAHRPRESYETPPRQLDDRDYSPRPPISPYEPQPDFRGEDRHSPLPERYDVSPLEEMRQYAASNDERPPPPPAHRSRHNSPGYQDPPPRHNFDVSPQKTPSGLPMRHDVLKNEAHRVSAPAYPGRPTYRGYDSAPSSPGSAALHGAPPYEQSSPRHHSYDSHTYDSAYDSQNRSMQPTVEDVPDSPTGSYGHGGRRVSRHDELGYESSPALPTQMNRSPNAAHYMNQSVRSRGSYQDEYDQHVDDIPAGTRQIGYHPAVQQPGHRSELEGVRIQSSPGYAPPALPPSLSPGLDPVLSQELSERIYEERRHESRHGDSYAMTPTRGRQRSEPPSSYVPGVGNSPQAFAPQSYDRRRSGVTFSGRAEPPMQRQNMSPGGNPVQQQTIRRKSISPAPPMEESGRKSDIPFGPDSYDALNPSVASPHDAASGAAHRDPNAKIIAHDGREIDPSDHLPMESWAPEPEAKPSQKQPSPEPRSRPSPSGAQPMPPSGRRPLRVARQSGVPSNPPSYSHHEEPQTPPAPASAGRNRLQKKTHRGSAVPSPSASSPLAPISPDNYQDRHSPYTPTRGAPHRGSAWDYPNENHAPSYSSGGPPIPAKVPLMSGAIGGESALMEEMARIDIGNGRSRRRGGY